MQELFARPVHSVAVLREPTERWLSELAFVTRTHARGTRAARVPAARRDGHLPVPRLRLSQGRDRAARRAAHRGALRAAARAHRAATPRLPAPRTSSCWPSRRTATLTRWASCSSFASRTLTAKFECNENKNVSPRAQKAAAARQPQQRRVRRRDAKDERPRPRPVAARARPRVVVPIRCVLCTSSRCMGSVKNVPPASGA